MGMNFAIDLVILLALIGNVFLDVKTDKKYDKLNDRIAKLEEQNKPK